MKIEEDKRRYNQVPELLSSIFVAKLYFIFSFGVRGRYVFPTFVLLAPDGQVIFSPYEKHGYVDDERQQLQAKLAEIFEE